MKKLYKNQVLKTEELNQVNKQKLTWHHQSIKW